MKIFTSWISLALVLVLLIACTGILIQERNQNDATSVKDFEFSLTFGPNGRNSINTFTGLITKDLVADGVISTDFNLSKNDRAKIGKMLADMGILSYPKNLKVRDYYDHIEIINLKVLIGDEEHFVTWTVPWEFDFEPEDKLTDLHRDFIEFVEYIINLVIESDEYKALPKASGGYL